MKTAISLPDKLYSDAEKAAKAMGIPRSQLFALALEEFINQHGKERITEQLNEVYGKYDQSEDQNMIMGLESLRELTQNDSW